MRFEHFRPSQDEHSQILLSPLTHLLSLLSPPFRPPTPPPPSIRQTIRNLNGRMAMSAPNLHRTNMAGWPLPLIHWQTDSLSEWLDQKPAPREMIKSYVHRPSQGDDWDEEEGERNVLGRRTCSLHRVVGRGFVLCVLFIRPLMNYSPKTLCLIVWRRPLTFNRVYIFDFPFSPVHRRAAHWRRKTSSRRTGTAIHLRMERWRWLQVGVWVEESGRSVVWIAIWLLVYLFICFLLPVTNSIDTVQLVYPLFISHFKSFSSSLAASLIWFLTFPFHVVVNITSEEDIAKSMGRRSSWTGGGDVGMVKIVWWKRKGRRRFVWYSKGPTGKCAS